MTDVSEKSNDYKAMEDYFHQVETILDGSDAIKDAGKKYLPQFPQEPNRDYDFRRRCAKFTNIFRDIVEGLSSKPFQKQLYIADNTASDEIFKLAEDIDGRGNDLHSFLNNTFFAGIAKGIDWIRVDYSKTVDSTGRTPRTLAEQKALGARPYWVHVPASSVIWIESDMIDGREQFTEIRINEPTEIDGKKVDRIRVMKRDGENAWFEIWEKRTDEKTRDEKWFEIEELGGPITIGIIPMVPFITGRRKAATWQIHPPMKDAADLQIELYQQESALKNIKASAAFPMLAGNGVQPVTDESGNPRTVPTGPFTVLYAPPNGDGAATGRWEWIQPSADLLNFLSEDVEKTMRHLRDLGRQPLTGQRGNITRISSAETAQKSNSAIQAWALNLSDAAEQAMIYTKMWLNETLDTLEPEVIIFTDFSLEDQGDKSIDALIEMRKNGDITKETLWAELQRRNVLRGEFDAENETERLLLELPGDGEF